MISKNDVLVLLSDLKDSGVDTSVMTRKLLQTGVSTEILTFINDNRPLDLANFYEKIRHTYNSHRSKLYINIMRETTIDNPSEVLTTLNAYAQQCLLFSRDLENRQVFLRFARLAEVYKALYYWSTSYDPTPAIELLKRIKNDIKVLETCYR